MAILSDGLYFECETRLRCRESSIRSAEEKLGAARADAYRAKPPRMDGSGGGRGREEGSDLERKALRIHEAEEQLRLALAWDDVARRLYRMFPPDTREGQIANCLYERGMTQEDVCRALHISRLTVRRCRDKLAANCALLAVQAGILRLEDE